MSMVIGIPAGSLFIWIALSDFIRLTEFGVNAFLFGGIGIIVLSIITSVFHIDYVLIYDKPNLTSIQQSSDVDDRRTD